MTKRIKQSKAERLENLSFWFIEYAYRNSQFSKWVKASLHLDKMIKPYEETIQELFSREDLPVVRDFDKFSANWCNWKELKNSPFSLELKNKCGDTAYLYWYKHDIFNQQFEKKFKTITPPIENRITTEKYMQLLLNHDEIIFSPYSLHEVAFIIHKHTNWSISISGLEPSFVSLGCYEKVELDVGPNFSLEDSQRAALEYKVLQLMRETTDLFEEQEVYNLSEETAGAVLELLIDLKSVNTSNIMRLAVLWIWDRVNEDNDESLDFDAKFSKYYNELKDRADAAGMDGKPWNQIYNKKGRVMTAYKNTDLSIKNMTIRDLNS